MTAQVKLYHGTPTLFIDGAPAPAAYMWTSPPNPDKWDSAPFAREYAAAGIHMFAFDVGTQGRPPEWCGPKRTSTTAPFTEAEWLAHFDFSTLTQRFERVLDADPQARFHLRVHLEMPPWWHALYPEECELVSNGERRNQSFASTLWRAQAKSFLRAYIAHIQQAGLAERVVAYQTGAGTTGEWVKETGMSRPTGDYSRPMQTHFQAWLRARYHDDASALRAAWNDRQITFETAQVPTQQEQLTTQDFCFRDPTREQKAVDYYACLADLCGDLVVDFNHTVKQATHGQALAGAFFGYLMELAWNSCYFGNGVEAETAATQRSGHLGLRKVLESPDVDFIVAPYSYGFRGIGGTGAPMPPVESVRLHGKLYICEEDSRAHTAKDLDYGHVYSMADSEAVLRRNFAEVLTRGSGVWWLGDHIDAFQEPAFRPLLRQFQRLSRFAQRLDRSPSAEIAVLLDDESFFHTTPNNDLDLPLIFQQRLWGLARIGAQHDLYLLQDLLDGKLPPYKLYIFLNPFALSSVRRKALARQIRCARRTAVWLYAPGYIRNDPGTGATSPQQHLEDMQDLTGFRFGIGMNPWGPQMHLTNFTHPITQGLAQDLQWGTNSRLGPLFHLADPAATILGQVVYSLGRCMPGMGVKTFNGPEGDWNSIYIAAPNVPAPVLRGIAKFAGVHLYSEAGDVLYATRDLLAVHTVSGGARTFRLPGRVEVIYDLFEQVPLAQAADQFTVQLPPASTALYYTGASTHLEQYRM